MLSCQGKKKKNMFLVAQGRRPFGKYGLIVEDNLEVLFSFTLVFIYLFSFRDGGTSGASNHSH